MHTYQTQQHRPVHRRRSFHFVPYEGHPADPKVADGPCVPMPLAEQ